jgi:hypothetical protein
MLRSTSLIRGYPSPQIHKYLTSTNDDLQKEIDADRLYMGGKTVKAIQEYLRLSFLHDTDRHTQGRVRIKIALALEGIGDHAKALEVWSGLLELFDGDGRGDDRYFLLTRYVTSKIVDIRTKKKKKHNKRSSKRMKRQHVVVVGFDDRDEENEI